MSQSPVLVVYAASKGTQMFLMASPDIAHYADAPDMVRLDMQSTNTRRRFITDEDTIQIVANADGSHQAFVTSARREDLDNTNISRWLIEEATRIAKENGWSIGQTTDNPRVYDGLYGDKDGIGIAQDIYEKPWML